eukprot:TRINITY_DN23166_c0_g1_i1.p1 TRINITY_DN23166_c0_g1~~TRINITY_DN23166_c0_g1_i1.p1  ORF type:complete len:609 (-),score=124.03 TRINITY_DN23166_c0_g1_i1:47-1873(-)
MSRYLLRLSATLAAGIVVLAQTLAQDSAGWSSAWICALLISGLSNLICLPTLYAALRAKSTSGAGKRVFLIAAIWTAGVGILTVMGPFTLTGNGYFGTWAAAVAAWMMAFADSESLRRPFERLPDGVGSSFTILLVASMTAFVQTSYGCVAVEHFCNATGAWMLVCSGSSVALCCALLVEQIAEKMADHVKIVGIFFLVWWAGNVAGTFEAPYETSYANGYFACWAAVAASALLVQRAFGLPSLQLQSAAAEVAGGAPPEIALLLLASLVVLAASAVACGDDRCSGYEVWAIICSSGSLMTCFAVVLFTFRGGWLAMEWHLPRGSAVLCAWWLMGCLVSTFAGPFQHMDNGYFGCWAALLSAGRLAARHAAPVTLTERADAFGLTLAGTRGRALVAVCCGSALLLLQALVDCTSGSCGAGQPYALLFAALALLCCAALGPLVAKVEMFERWIVLGLALWWSCGVFVLTFHRPYVRTGNAYFACWAAWAGSGTLLVLQFPQLRGYADLEEGSATIAAASSATAEDADGVESGGAKAPSFAGASAAQGVGAEWELAAAGAVGAGLSTSVVEPTVFGIGEDDAQSEEGSLSGAREQVLADDARGIDLLVDG